MHQVFENQFMSLWKKSKQFIFFYEKLAHGIEVLSTVEYLKEMNEVFQITQEKFIS